MWGPWHHPALGASLSPSAHGQPPEEPQPHSAVLMAPCCRPRSWVPMASPAVFSYESRNRGPKACLRGLCSLPATPFLPRCLGGTLTCWASPVTLVTPHFPTQPLQGHLRSQWAPRLISGPGPVSTWRDPCPSLRPGPAGAQQEVGVLPQLIREALPCGRKGESPPLVTSRGQWLGCGGFWGRRLSGTQLALSGCPR